MRKMRPIGPEQLADFDVFRLAEETEPSWEEGATCDAAAAADETADEADDAAEEAEEEDP